MRHFKIYIVLLGLILMTAAPVGAQLVHSQDYQKVDTFQLRERFAFRTNLPDWAALTPNIGVEFDLRRVNWARYTLTLDLMGNFIGKHTFKPGFVYQRAGVRLGGKYYFRFRNGKHPKTVMYAGVYASFQSFALMPFTEHGYQGMFAAAGGSFGILRPLIVYNNGNSLDLELGIDLGAVMLKHDKFVLNRENNSYDVVGSRDFQPLMFPVPTELRVGLVYRLGKKMEKERVRNELTNRYRDRMYIDLAYKDYVDSIAERKEFVRDSLIKRNEFLADSVGLVAPLGETLAMARNLMASAAFADTTTAHYFVLRSAMEMAEKDIHGLMDFSDNRRDMERDVIGVELNYYANVAARMAGVNPADYRPAQKGAKAVDGKAANSGKKKQSKSGKEKQPEPDKEKVLKPEKEKQPKPKKEKVLKSEKEKELKSEEEKEPKPEEVAMEEKPMNGEE